MNRILKNTSLHILLLFIGIGVSIFAAILLDIIGLYGQKGQNSSIYLAFIFPSMFLGLFAVRGNLLKKSILFSFFIVASDIIFSSIVHIDSISFFKNLFSLDSLIFSFYKLTISFFGVFLGGIIRGFVLPKKDNLTNEVNSKKESLILVVGLGICSIFILPFLWTDFFAKLQFESTNASLLATFFSTITLGLFAIRKLILLNTFIFSFFCIYYHALYFAILLSNDGPDSIHNTISFFDIFLFVPLNLVSDTYFFILFFVIFCGSLCGGALRKYILLFFNKVL